MGSRASSSQQPATPFARAWRRRRLPWVHRRRYDAGIEPAAESPAPLSCSQPRRLRLSSFGLFRSDPRAHLGHTSSYFTSPVSLSISTVVFARRNGISPSEDSTVELARLSSRVSRQRERRARLHPLFEDSALSAVCFCVLCFKATRCVTISGRRDKILKQ